MFSMKRLHFMKSLQTVEQIQLLNLIDSLRAKNLSEFTALSQLIVCEDQSSDKSSLLETISKVSFSRKDNLCTRFATEIILRRAFDSEITVFLICLDLIHISCLYLFMCRYQKRVNSRQIKIDCDSFDTRCSRTMTLRHSLSRLKMS